MKKAVGVGLPLVLILAVSVYLIGTLSWEEEQLSKPGHRVIKRSISLPHADLHEVLRTAASEHAPEYVKNHALVQDALRAAAGKDAPDYLKNRAVGQEALQAVAADEDAPVYVKNPAIVRDVPRAEAAENVYVKNPEIVQEAPRASAVEDDPAYVNKLAIVRDAPRAVATEDVYVKNPEIVQEAPRAAAAEDSLDYLKNQALVQDALREAAAEDAPTDAKDKRFLPAIANLAGQLFSSEGGLDADKLTETIKKLGSMENMAPDIMAQSVQHEAEVEAQVEKQGRKIWHSPFASTRDDQPSFTCPPMGNSYSSRRVEYAEVDFVADKGMVQDDMFAPPGLHMRVDVEQDPGKDSEPDQSSQPMAYGYPVGMGAALMNGCFGTGYKAGDPCYNVRDVIPACYNMMEGCGYIGVGFDGRGDYSSTSRRKSVVQRNCKNLATYHDEDVPDTMNVHGIFDTEVSSYVYESRESYRHSLQAKAGMSFSGWGFQAAVDSAYGKSTSSDKQKFMSLIQCNVIRYEIFLDEISPDTLSLPFLRDFLALPTNFILGKLALLCTVTRAITPAVIPRRRCCAPNSNTYTEPQTNPSRRSRETAADRNVSNHSKTSSRKDISFPGEKFIIRYGTHFIKSAKFGGSFRLFKTQEASKTESLEDFSIQAQASYNSLFFNAGGHFGVGSSKGSSQSDKTSSTHVTVEGGDQEVASIVADFYSTGFKDTFTEWLKSVPKYPKPIEMFMGTMSELLNLNYKLLFPFDITDVADGCFSQSLKTEEGTGRKYYEVGKMVNNSQGVMKPVKEKRYCDFTSADKFEKEMDKKRLALERAIAVYMEEGPVPTTDFRLEGGKPGCTSQALKVKGVSLVLPPPHGWNSSTGTRIRWNCHAPGAEVHMYNSRNNGESGDTRKKKIEHIEPPTCSISNTSVKISAGGPHRLPPAGWVRLQYYIDRESSNGKNTHSCINTVMPADGVSCYGFVMTYQEASGTFIVTQEDEDASTQVLGRLPRSYVDWTVARAEYVSPMEHARATGGALANIVQAPCHVKWSNSYQIKPAEEGGRCLYFVAASAGDIFAVFSAIPRDVSTWYHLQISYQGVALYKGMKLVKYEGAKSARSLGDSKLFQPYFICLEEDAEMMRTYIKYGVGSDTSEKGLVYMVYIYQGPPLGIRFYSFGSGEKPVEIMDARVIEGGATGDMECTGGTVLKDGICVEDCHPECNGCIPTSPGSKLNTECRSCKHVSFKNEAGRTECIAECPTGTQPAGVDGKTCLAVVRDDGRCGTEYPAEGANPGQCDPYGNGPCCSSINYCDSADQHCTCETCKDYRVNVAMGKTAYQSSTGTGPASRAVDGITDGDFESSSCSHTKLDTGEPYPSWWVDLGQPMQIGRVVIWNRMDCCSDRINDFNIHIGNNTQVS
ncbi:hypothetical protein Bbelb_242580 [Branchiostoma belcheri]|nr:hypothetical protein Bbelb_242580 [Branchiostoma belcheri]